MAQKRKGEKQVEVVGFLGIGLDDADGHHRVTTGDNFLFVGGSDKTHTQMVDTTVQVNELLQQRGKRLADVSVEEVLDLFREASERLES